MNLIKRRSGNYRCNYINYRKPGIFLITMNKRIELPPFSHIIHNPYDNDEFTGYKPNYFDLGYVIYNQLADFDQIQPKIRIKQYIIMPDHIHLILQIVEELDISLGKYLAMFKRNIYEEASKRNIINKELIDSIFDRGYNDQYLLRSRKLDPIYRYIKKNPYWWWARWNYPDFFRRQCDIEICGVKCSLYGNLSLIDNPCKYPVIVHRSELHDSKIMNRKREFWNYGIFNGGVIAGAFVNKAEKDILQKAIENGGKIIMLSNRDYKQRQKPEEDLLWLCSKGQLLIISPALDLYLPKNREFREECLFMNDLAERIGMEI